MGEAEATALKGSSIWLLPRFPLQVLLAEAEGAGAGETGGELGAGGENPRTSSLTKPESLGEVMVARPLGWRPRTGGGR